MQVVLVYLQSFRCSSMLNCTLQPKIAKNLLKTFLGVQDHLRLSTLTLVNSLSLLFVMKSGMFVPICNRFHAIHEIIAVK